MFLVSFVFFVVASLFSSYFISSKYFPFFSLDNETEEQNEISHSTFFCLLRPRQFGCQSYPWYDEHPLSFDDDKSEETLTKSTADNFSVIMIRADKGNNLQRLLNGSLP